MKKTILIILGILIILAVIGVWVYLFTFGTPKSSEEVFSKFGFGGSNAEIIDAPVIAPSTVDITEDIGPNSSEKLQQLTTRPVAGATFTESAILYVEQGTGHVYSIDLKTGEETLVNGTTVTQSREAVFSEDASYVAITSYGAIGSSVIVEKVAGDEEGFTLPQGAQEVAFGKIPHTLTYLLEETEGSSGYSYNILKETSARLFTIPLREVHVLWGSPTYVYTTPSASAVGFMYRIDGNALSYVTHGGFGLMGFPYDDGVVITKSEGGGVQSFTIPQSGDSVTFPFSIIPEKCTHLKSIIYCAIPTKNIDVSTFPDSWYKGVLSYTDILWSLNPTTGAATMLSNFLSESGREIDVSKIGIDELGERLYFVNKNDNTLWVFDMTVE